MQRGWLRRTGRRSAESLLKFSLESFHISSEIARSRSLGGERRENVAISHPG